MWRKYKSFLNIPTHKGLKISLTPEIPQKKSIFETPAGMAGFQPCLPGKALLIKKYQPIGHG